MNRPAPSRVRLYDEDDLDRVLRSMARQAMACLPASEVALVGIQRRGEPLAQRLQQAQALLMEGAAYNDIDDALLEFGFPMGPFQMSDLAGLDIGWHRDPSKVTTIREALCAKGRWGQKTGKGFYDYDAERKRTPSDEVKAIIDANHALGTTMQINGTPSFALDGKLLNEVHSWEDLYPVLSTKFSAAPG